MSRKTRTPEEKAEALRLVAEVGQAEAARRLGIPVGTVASWAQRAEVQAPEIPARTKANQAAQAAWATRKVELAHRLVDDLERLRQQLFAPSVEQKVVVVSDGATLGSHAEVVEVRRDRPTYSDQKAIMTSLAIGVDKVLLMLGDATERTETLHLDGADQGKRAADLIDELARRREQRSA